MANCENCIHYEIIKNEASSYCLCSNAFNIKERQRHNSTFKCDHFKDKSRYIELPCKVGDTVYIPTSNGIINEKVHRILYSQEAENYGKFIRNRFYTIVGNTEAQFDFSDIGKTVFLTYEEAEKALKELEDD